MFHPPQPSDLSKRLRRLAAIPLPAAAPALPVPAFERANIGFNAVNRLTLTMRF